MVQKAVMNTKKAASEMGWTENWLHKLVYRGDIKAYIYDENGALIEKEAKTKRQGQGLYFYKKDLDAYRSRGKGKGRPSGSKDKVKRVLKTAENIPINPLTIV